MHLFIIRRLLLLIVVIFGVSLIIFSIMMTFSPERRAAAYIHSPQQVKDIPKIVKQYGLDDPFHTQYIRWVREIFRGNMGYSLVSAMPVVESFWKFFPVSLELNLYCIPFLIIFGIWLGTTAGLNKDRPADHITRIFAIMGYAPPTFIVALVLLMFFYGFVPWFPPGIVKDEFLFLIQDPARFHRYTYLLTIDALLNGRFDIFIDALRHLVLPVIAEVTVLIALIIRILRSSLVEELTKDYIITAKAKGADHRTVNIKHARRNALLPVITITGQLVAMMVTGAVSAELIFNRPGVGWWLANAATQLDMPAIMGIALFAGTFVVIVNLIVDIIYAYVDPRIRLS